MDRVRFRLMPGRSHGTAETGHRHSWRTRLTPPRPTRPPVPRHVLCSCFMSSAAGSSGRPTCRRHRNGRSRSLRRRCRSELTRRAVPPSQCRLQPKLVASTEIIGRPGDVAVWTNQKCAHRLLCNRRDDGIDPVCPSLRRGSNRAPDRSRRTGRASCSRAATRRRGSRGRCDRGARPAAAV